MTSDLQQRINELTECPICSEQYAPHGIKTPKLMKCGHTVCQSCGEELCSRRERFRCPCCRKLLNVPANGIASLPNNLAVIGFLQVKDFIVTQPDETTNVASQDRRRVVARRQLQRDDQQQMSATSQRTAGNTQEQQKHANSDDDDDDDDDKTKQGVDVITVNDSDSDSDA